MRMELNSESNSREGGAGSHPKKVADKLLAWRWRKPDHYVTPK